MEISNACVRLEISRLYRAAKTGRREAGETARLVWILGQVRACLEAEAIERLEQKMDAMQESIVRKDGALLGWGHGHGSVRSQAD
jgi:hypothetical protein